MPSCEMIVSSVKWKKCDIKSLKNHKFCHNNPLMERCLRKKKPHWKPYESENNLLTSNKSSWVITVLVIPSSAFRVCSIPKQQDFQQFCQKPFSQVCGGLVSVKDSVNVKSSAGSIALVRDPSAHGTIFCTTTALIYVYSMLCQQGLISKRRSISLESSIKNAIKLTPIQ